MGGINTGPPKSTAKAPTPMHPSFGISFQTNTCNGLGQLPRRWSPARSGYKPAVCSPTLLHSLHLQNWTAGEVWTKSGLGKKRREISLSLAVFFFNPLPTFLSLLIKLSKKTLIKTFYYLLPHKSPSGTFSPWPQPASLCRSGSEFWAHHRLEEHKGCHNLGFQWWAPENE